MSAGTCTCIQLTVVTQNQTPPVLSSLTSICKTTTSTYPLSPALDNTKAKCVKNLSCKPLTEVQISLLARDADVAVLLLYSPKEEYTVAVEEAFLELLLKMAEELRVETSQVLKCDCLLNPNISRQEARALKEVHQDKFRVILTADKGVKMVVVLDKISTTIQDLLAQKHTYKPQVADSTNEYKNKLIKILRNIRVREV